MRAKEDLVEMATDRQHWNGAASGFHDQMVQTRWNDFLAGWRRINMSSQPMLSHRQSAYCPTCKSFTSQSRGYRYGTRYCGICGDEFSLQQSREAFKQDHGRESNGYDSEE